MNLYKGRIMDNQNISAKFAAVAMALLLILIAWGNAMVMLIVAIIGLVVFVLISRENITRGGALAAIVGFVLAIVIRLVMMLR